MLIKIKLNNVTIFKVKKTQIHYLAIDHSFSFFKEIKVVPTGVTSLDLKSVKKINSDHIGKLFRMLFDIEKVNRND